MDASKLAYTHAHMKYVTIDGEDFVLPAKAYNNTTWLSSHVRTNGRGRLHPRPR